MGGHRQIGGFATYEKVVAPPGGWGPSKGSLALILPTAWVPSAHKATDGHAFRRHMRPELFASQGFAHAFIPSGVDSRGFPSSLLHRNVSHGCITPASS